MPGFGGQNSIIVGKYQTRNYGIHMMQKIRRNL